MKTIIEMAREAADKDKDDPVRHGLITLTNEELETFAALVKAAHVDELLEGVEMPEAVGSAEVFSGHNAHGLPEYAYVDAYTADQLRETVAAAVMREREACAKVVEGGRFLHDQSPAALLAKEAATAIRNRSKA